MKKRPYGDLTPDKIKLIQLGYFKGRWKQTELANIFNVSQSSIARAIGDRG